jgi:hypothetical protein
MAAFMPPPYADGLAEDWADGDVVAPPLIEQAATRRAADTKSKRDRLAVIRSYSRGVS